MNELIEAGTKTALSTNPLGVFFLELDDISTQKIFNSRLEKLNSKIEDLELFKNKMNYLANDETKYIHLRNYLKFYFVLSDPALIETNIRLIIDYVLEKNKYGVYDVLLEKMCLLNKFSIEILKELKKISDDSNGFYNWKELMILYNIDYSYSQILTMETNSELYAKISYGFKNLIESGFIVNYPTSYPGSVDVISLDKFKLTSIAHLLSSYL